MRRRKLAKSALSRILFFFLLVTIAWAGSGCLTSAHFVQGKEELSYLTGVDELRIEFDHSNTSVASFADEEDFIKDKVEEKNAEEKGSGDEWAKKWRKNKEEHFEPKFVLNLDKSLRKKGISLTREEKTPYVLVVRVERIDPGYFDGVSGRPAKMVSRLEIFKNDNMDDPLTVLRMEAEGGGAFTTKQMIGHAFKESATYYSRYFDEHL